MDATVILRRDPVVEGSETCGLFRGIRMLVVLGVPTFKSHWRTQSLKSSARGHFHRNNLYNPGHLAVAPLLQSMTNTFSRCLWLNLWRRSTCDRKQKGYMTTLTRGMYCLFFYSSTAGIHVTPGKIGTVTVFLS